MLRGNGREIENQLPCDDRNAICAGHGAGVKKSYSGIHEM